MALASKDSVNYSTGMRTRHCGPSRKWEQRLDPRHYCKHFYKDGLLRGACHKVEGRIDQNYWCKLFQPKGI